MNSIARRRKRPRQASINLRVFKWVLLREVALLLYAPGYESWGGQKYARSWLARQNKQQVEAFVARQLLRYPERRIVR